MVLFFTLRRVSGLAKEEERKGKKNPSNIFPLGASQIMEGPQRVASSEGRGRPQLLDVMKASNGTGWGCFGVLMLRDSFLPNLGLM